MHPIQELVYRINNNIKINEDIEKFEEKRKLDIAKLHKILEYVNTLHHSITTIVLKFDNFALNMKRRDCYSDDPYYNVFFIGGDQDAESIFANQIAYCALTVEKFEEALFAALEENIFAA